MKMNHNTDIPIKEACEKAETLIEKGWSVYMKYTCSLCGQRKVGIEPNTFHETMKCDSCGAITNIEETGCGFMAIFPRSDPTLKAEIEGFAWVQNDASDCGAIPIGTRIEKCNSKGDDAHVDGDGGVVASSIYVGNMEDAGVENEEFAYFVEWDDAPGLKVGICGSRIRRAQQS